MLFDAGCEYHGYVSDVTRVWPIGGQFTAAQRNLYELVLRVKQASIKVMVLVCDMCGVCVYVYMYVWCICVVCICVMYCMCGVYM